MTLRMLVLKSVRMQPLSSWSSARHGDCRIVVPPGGGSGCCDGPVAGPLHGVDRALWLWINNTEGRGKLQPREREARAVSAGSRVMTPTIWWGEKEQKVSSSHTMAPR